jgi:hypothetical protein
VFWPLIIKAYETTLRSVQIGVRPRNPKEWEAFFHDTRQRNRFPVYSIGFDLTDNQGNINREHPEDAGVDLGFRLWNVNRRRQKPPPVVVIPE